MRFYKLDAVPPGLHFDEAFNSLDALSLLNIPLLEWPVFFEGNSGREPLHVWLTGLSHVLFGPSVWTARSVSALSGVLLIPATAWLGWQVAPALGVRQRRLFSLWSATAVLALLWSQMFARYGLRASLYVLIQTLLWAALWRAWQMPRPTLCTWVVTGFLAGLSFYTYLPARLIPIVFPPLLIAALIQEPLRLRKHLPGLLSALAMAILIAAPLISFFLRNPTAFYLRLAQVGVSDEVPFFSNIASVLGMFLWRGDTHITNNVSGRPALDPLLALPFLLGLGMCASRFWRLGRLFLLTGFIVQLLPSLLSSNAPSFLRAIGALPFAALLTAYGAEVIVTFVGLSRMRIQLPARALIWAVFVTSITLTNWTYFRVWGPSPGLFNKFNVGISLLVPEIADEKNAAMYVDTYGGIHNPILSYLLRVFDTSARFYHGQKCLPLALNGPARYLSLGNDESRGRLQPDHFYRTTEERTPVIYNREGSPWMAERRFADTRAVDFSEMRPLGVDLADGISLAGYWLSQDSVQAEQPLVLRLFWQADAVPSADYTTFIHLVKVNEDGSTVLMAGFDRRPGDGTCATNRWLPNEIVIDHVELTMPANLPSHDLFLAVGFYSLADGQRLPVGNANDDQILLGPLRTAP